MSDDGQEVKLRPLELPPIDRSRRTESEFWDDLIAAGNELRTSIAECSALVPQAKIKARHLAVLMGLMVRLYKLFDTFLLLTCEHRMEVSMIVVRSACDTAIDLLYLCEKRKTDLLDEFIRTSLATSKRIYEQVIQDENDGVGDDVVRDRIKSSIEDDFRDAGLSLSDVDSRKWRRKHDTAARAKACGIEDLYLFLYKNLSRVTHGSWSELMKYHLLKGDESWTPNLSFAVPRPQIMSSFPVLVAMTTIAYSENVTLDSVMPDRLQEIIDWFMRMSDAHEEFLRNQDCGS